jgi:hypothetical protein
MHEIARPQGTLRREETPHGLGMVNVRGRAAKASYTLREARSAQARLTGGQIE